MGDVLVINRAGVTSTLKTITEQFPSIVIRHNGCEIGNGVTESDWHGIVKYLVAIANLNEIEHSQVMWALADALHFGEVRFGAERAALAETLNISRGTVYNVAWMANVTPEARVLPSFWNHSPLASLKTADEQVIWAKKALDGGWSGDTLRLNIKSSQLPKLPASTQSQQETTKLSNELNALVSNAKAVCASSPTESVKFAKRMAEDFTDFVAEFDAEDSRALENDIEELGILYAQQLAEVLEKLPKTRISYVMSVLKKFC